MAEETQQALLKQLAQELNVLRMHSGLGESAALAEALGNADVPMTPIIPPSALHRIRSFSTQQAYYTYP